MYEHKFVKIKLSSFKLVPEEDYHAVIHEHEKEGWELVQIFAPGIKGYGTPSFFELIFKREKER
ncbi:DUF4177 domain-containing protein [Bacillus thermotolerans]|uniref:DUF4177 domain-containing protein n=1 Tax=Bacillus thermotolerans TaxID=1221996 RepID=A0A0F5HXZ0_BACTR|nr:DUF4177 domain-containing protein [Bacillus thermotolerans]KKB37717.1 hypothetical protein QY95_02827 [Bacillus thermotolerans]